MNKVTPKVFIIGFHKTGTSSISVALEYLGYNVIHGDSTSAFHGGTEGVALLEKYIKRGNYQLPTLDLYDAFADNPYFSIWEELIKQYPDAKYILSIRDEDKWIDSCVRYYAGRRVRPMREWMFGQHADPSANEESRQQWLKKYRNHNQKIMDYFKSINKDLLVIDISKGDGWTELCAFLGQKIPQKDFPHINKSIDGGIRNAITKFKQELKAFCIKGVTLRIYKKLFQIYCNYHPVYSAVDSRVPKIWVASRSSFQKTGKYCYFRIPKCANSTISKTLAHYDPSIVYDDNNDIDGKVAKSKFANIGATHVLSKTSLRKKYSLFTFVRNPYTRVLSAYLDKIDGFKKAFFETRSSVRQFSESGNVTFEAFVTYLENGGLFHDPHWAPQTYLLPLAPSEIPFIGKVENIDKDLSALVNHLFGEGAYKDPKNREDSRKKSSEIASDYYTDDLKNRVYKLYKVDFDAFSYPQDTPF
ncbi:sulfotransferase [Methylotenera sp. G11]|uniref:sulfotransferase n=1 Tax=Methylotenera sp. G11 TaxID=1506585 RepID=UPI000648C714|nr:sulfotransferase [Methylotenera sp. G11]